jgi:hypothetical protein
LYKLGVPLAIVPPGTGRVKRENTKKEKKDSPFHPLDKQNELERDRVEMNAVGDYFRVYTVVGERQSQNPRFPSVKRPHGGYCRHQLLVAQP